MLVLGHTVDVNNEPGPIALVGSGEYLPSMLEVERSLLHNRPKRYVQIATAAAPEGDGSLSRWHNLGAQQAQRLGVEQVIVDVRTADDANDQRWVDAIAGAGLIYLSGGNPSYLADTLRGSLVWAAIEATWRGGAALAGCSAGAMVMAERIPSLRHPVAGDSTGLALLPHLRVIPHFDRMAGWMPEGVSRLLMHGVDGVTLLGIDEETALVGGPHQWRVEGHRQVWRLERTGRQAFSAGEVVDLASN